MDNFSVIPELQNKFLLARIISSEDQSTTDPQEDHINSAKIIPGAITVVVLLIIVTAAVVYFAFRYARKNIEEQRALKAASQLHIPDHVKALSDPVKFTIPTAPQLPHEMQRGYMHHIRTSVPCIKTGGNGNGKNGNGNGKKGNGNGKNGNGNGKNGNGKIGRVRAPRLSLIGRSKSAKSTFSEEREMFSMTRSKSDPCRLGRHQGPISSSIGILDPALYAPDDDLQEFRPSKYGLGKLSFSLTYQKDMHLLTVNLIQAAQLPVWTQQQKTTDTFVKISLIPDSENKRMTTSRIYRRSVNPRYNQSFVFRLAESAIVETMLRFVVFQYDRYSHPHVVGRADYELENHDFDILGPNHTIWRDLVEHPWEEELPPVDTSRGEILFSLNYLPTAERLSITVLKARNLRTSIADSPTVVPYSGAAAVVSADSAEACPAPTDKTALGIYVKVTIVKGGKQVKTKQTTAVRKDLNPVFNESFSMELKTDELDMTCIVLSICLRVNHLKCHRILGRCVVGGEIICSGKVSAHWNEMLSSPRSSVARWHALK